MRYPRGMGWQEIRFRIPSPGRVVADFGNHEILSDHPPDSERDGRDPEPWRLFLASIGACMASFVAARCREEGVPSDSIEIVQRHRFGDGDALAGFDVEIRVPPDFSPELRVALAEAAADCSVKRTIEAGPEFSISVA